MEGDDDKLEDSDCLPVPLKMKNPSLSVGV